MVVGITQGVGDMQGDDSTRFLGEPIGPEEPTAPGHTPGGGRRGTTTIAIVLAALAVIAAVLWSTYRGDRGAGSGPATASTSTVSPTQTFPSVTPTSSAPPTAAPTGDADAPSLVVTVRPGAALVERPELPYLLDKTLHRGLDTVSYAASDQFGFIPLRGGRALLLENTRETDWDTAQVTDSTGRSVARVTAPAGRHLSAAADGTGERFALLEASLEDRGTSAVLTLYDSEGRALLTLRGVRDQFYPVGFVGERLFLGDHGGDGTHVWDLARNTVSEYSEQGRPVGVSEQSGRVAFVELADFAEPRCTTVADVRGAVPVAVSRTCGLFYPTELSSDGGYLLGVEVPSDGMLQSSSRVIDVGTGRPVVVLHEPTPMDSDSRFLSDGSVGLNLMVSDGGAWSNTLMRCTLTGECTRMVETLPVPNFDDRLLTRYRLVREPG